MDSPIDNKVHQIFKLKNEKMQESNTEKSSKIIIGIILFAISVIIFFLILAIIFNSIKVANIITSTSIATNESGWLNQTGYTLNQSYRDSFNVISLNVTSNGVILGPGNYTLIGNKLYNATQLSC